MHQQTTGELNVVMKDFMCVIINRNEKMKSYEDKPTLPHWNLDKTANNDENLSKKSFLIQKKRIRWVIKT